MPQTPIPRVSQPARVPLARTTIRVQLKAGGVTLLLHPDGSISLSELGETIDLSAAEAREMIGRVMVHQSDVKASES